MASQVLGIEIEQKISSRKLPKTCVCWIPSWVSQDWQKGNFQDELNLFQKVGHVSCLALQPSNLSHRPTEVADGACGCLWWWADLRVWGARTRWGVQIGCETTENCESSKKPKKNKFLVIAIIRGVQRFLKVWQKHWHLKKTTVRKCLPDVCEQR